MLNFDDGLPSHLDNAIPELLKRDIPGTFFLCPDMPQFRERQEEWELLHTKDGVFFGNHTMTHKGAPDIQTFTKEIMDCSTYILRVNPPSDSSPLLSYAKPGGVDNNWKISEEEHEESKLKAHLIQRVKSMNNQAGIKVHTAQEMMAIVENTLTAHSEGSVLFHGVGGDWLSVDLNEFIAFLDLLKKKESDLWLASHLDISKYDYERNHSNISSITTSKDEIQVSLQTEFDTGLYDEALTLVTRIPDDWKGCQVSYDGNEFHINASQQTISYEITPKHSKTEIILRKQ